MAGRPGTALIRRPMRSDVIDGNVGLAADPGHRRYWSRNLKLIALLMPVWALVTFGIGYFARELDFTMLGWPFSFWVGAQGALIVYVALVACYARAMNRLDRLTNAGDAEPLGTTELLTTPPGTSSGERTAAPATTSATYLHDRS